MGVRTSAKPDVSKATWEKAKTPEPRMRVPAARLQDLRRRSGQARLLSFFTPWRAQVLSEFFIRRSAARAAVLY